ncbi:MAG: 1-acyl-sn-glycerol-3-phosphate acyltransferase [Kiritimatiellae bacterium]|nr:1-acyl-sn-glycerol-3-phosphate acyltransferase [Kiritimatiellia bacterium]
MAEMSRALYGFSRWLVRVGLRLKYGMTCEGAENVPAEGGVVVAANHCSYLDPPVLACAVPRPVRFMARDTLFSNAFARWYFPRVGVIPLDRTRGDVAALRTAIALLKAGNAVALYPEGTRSEDGKLHEAKGGIGFLIAKAAVPVVPVHIAGTFEAFPKGAKKFRPARIAVRIGTPIAPEELQGAMTARNDYDSVGRLVMSRIAALAPE